ncbi:MAG TPA: PQQ-binding-like beta-propeller repeat protein, partial [Planctomycetota bacterium]|nr:PQQ-binding-like beta-propeller repeat protein [Planctomycetota bacterium]
RYLFVVNNTNTTFDPGQLWRVNLGMTSKVPLVASIKLNGSLKVVYDVFAGKKADVKDGVVQADLRSMPFRVFAILPAEIAAVKLSGPKAADAGNTVAWTASAVDFRWNGFAATVPMRVRLVSGHPRAASDKEFPMRTLDEAFVSAGMEAQARTFTIPQNTKTPNLVIEGTELITGRSAIVEFPVKPRLEPQDIAAVSSSAPTVAASAEAIAGKQSIGLQPAESLFGPHVRDIAISDNGRIALVCTNNWDHNLYAVNTRNGKTLWRQKVGHYFAFCPQPIKGGFAVQGFDMNSAEGYQLYLLDEDGKIERRFALYGLPRRLPHRFVPNILKDATNNFAVAPDGSWVASAGDLGLAVWSRKGKLLWSQEWFKTARHTGVLAALDAKTLLVAEGLTATAYDAANGKQLWQLKDLAATGEVKRALVSRDGKTVVLAASTEGGRLFIIRDVGADGVRPTAIPTPIDDYDLSADGSLIAVTAKNQLKLYSVADGLRWVMPGDDRLRAPRISPDGTRISASSDIGTAYILDQDGKILITHDMLARPITAWTRGDYLAIGTWAGTFNTLHSDATSWSAQDLMANGRLQPEALDMRGKLLVDDKTPTSRMESWGNAEPQPLAIAPNPLTDLKPISRFVPSAGWGGWAEFVHDGALLYDGKPDPPAEPWVLWARVGFFAETSPINYILIDAFRTRMRVDAITLFEDPAHPE